MGKYFKYAIGEIILVMIGILLALQVSNWNQDRKDRISERKILDNIHRDFLYNKASFDSIKKVNISNLRCLDSMVALFPLDMDTVKINKSNRFRYQIRNITYNAYSGTVNALINSNSIHLIQNDELQKHLVSWNDVLSDYLEEEEWYIQFLQEQYRPYGREAFDFTNKNIEMNREAASTLKYQNIIMSRRGYIKDILDAIEEEPIENNINEILRLTKPEE